jgi:hypothetical protein
MIVQRNIVTQIASQHAYEIAAHITAVAIANSRRPSAVAALFSIRLVGNLADTTVSALGVETRVRGVKISPEVQQHILKQRRIVSQADADLAVGRLVECVEHLEFWLQPMRPAKGFELIGFAASIKRHLRVALKFVPAAAARSKEDEWWIQTAVPFGEQKMKALLRRRASLAPIPLGARSSVGND